MQTEPQPSDTRVDTLLRRVGAAPSVDVPVWLARGTALDGKYRIDGVLGRGGMGIVYGATDLRLRRSVAIKLPVLSQRALERLRREARTIARLNHPNVVAVLDIGLVGGAVWLAMENVEGGSARRWLADHADDWRQIVALFVDAGRGLAAAHAAGIAHGDFKLDNVLVGADGRARVSDFGLAAELGRDGADDRIAGTPAYLAPERLAGRPLDAAADQFAFCVSLWEALHGEHPFADAGTRASIASAIVRRPAQPERAPSWLRRVLERGMARDPASRYPDLASLLVALQRRRWPPLTLLAGLGIALLLVTAFAPRDREPPCADLTARRSAAWSASRRDALRESVGVDARSRATVERLESRLDGFAAEWGEVAMLACTMPGPHACLDRSMTELEALLDVLEADATKETLTSALLQAERLSTPRSCLHAEPSTSPIDVDPRRSRELREAIARIAVRSEAIAADLDDVEFDALVHAARELGDGALVAEALMQRAFRHQRFGRYEDAREDLTAAYFGFAEAGHDRFAVLTAARVPSILVSVGRYDEASWWAEHARALARRQPTDTDGRFELAIALAALAAQLGDVEAAEASLEEARSEAARTDDRPYRHAMVLARMADVARMQGHVDDAVEFGERARQEHERVFGPQHPLVGGVLANHGWVLEAAGRYDEARRSFEESIAVLRQTIAVDHPMLLGPNAGLALLDARAGEPARALERLDSMRASGALARGTWEQSVRVDELTGDALARLGRMHEAIAAYERALATQEAVLGPEHPDLMYGLSNIALELADNGDHERARQGFERAIAISQRHGNRDPLMAAIARFNLGFLLLDVGEPHEALRRFEAAREIQREVVGADHPDVGWSSLGIGEAHLALGRPDLAVAPLEQTAKAWSSGAVSPEERGQALFALARALAKTDRDRAAWLAHEAQRLRPDDAEIAAWLSGDPRRARASAP